MKPNQFSEFRELFKEMGMSYDEYQELVGKMKNFPREKVFSINKKPYTIWEADKKRSGCRVCGLLPFWQIARNEGKKILPKENIGCPFFYACASIHRKDKKSVSFVKTSQ